MKIISWLKSKIHGKDNTIKPETESPSYHQQISKDGFSGCSSTLLAIGTFGNNLNQSDDANIEESLPSNEDHVTVEEFDEELRRLLNHHISLDSTISGESEHFDLPIEKILEGLPKDEEITYELINDESENKDALLYQSGKDIPSSSRRKGIYKKSLSFLLKKALLCRGGFTLSPILKDPFPDPTLDKSRMDKILRAVLRKKKNPQRQKYLDTPKTGNNEEREDSNRNTWVKTDSENIFLEL